MTSQPHNTPSNGVSLKIEARNSAVHTFATSSAFQDRAAALKWKLNLLTYVGLVLPAVVGGVALAFGPKSFVLPVFIAVAGSILAAQTAISLWSLVAKWPDEYSYANESVIANQSLARRYREISTSALRDEDLKVTFDLIRTEDESRQNQDLPRNFAAKEKRKGMRSALHTYQFPCAICQKTPISMTPTDCDTCGNF